MQTLVIGSLVLLFLSPEMSHSRIVDFSSDNSLFHPFVQKIRNYRSKDYLIKLLKRNLEQKLRKNRMLYDQKVDDHYRANEKLDRPKCNCNCKCNERNFNKRCEHCEHCSNSNNGENSNPCSQNMEGGTGSPCSHNKEGETDTICSNNNEGGAGNPEGEIGNPLSSPEDEFGNPSSSNTEDQANNPCSNNNNNEHKDNFKHFVCQKEGSFANPINCRQFYICYHNDTEPIDVTCPKGFAFDTTERKCTRKAARQCIKNQMSFYN